MIETRFRELLTWVRQHGASATPHNGIVPVGGIIQWSGAIADIPDGWALCDGSGGTPDLRGRMIVGASQDAGGAGSGASYDVGAAGGADTVTLDAANVPPSTVASAAEAAHLHTITDGGLHDHSGATGTQSVTHQHPAGGLGTNNTGSGHTHENVDSGGVARLRKLAARVLPAAGAADLVRLGGAESAIDATSTGSTHTHGVTGSTGNADASHTHTVSAQGTHAHGGATGAPTAGHSHNVTVFPGAATGHENRPRFYALAYIMRIA
jgi:microcystin-dependent protein